MSVKPRREQYKDLTRAALLQAATERFAQRGFAGTTIDDVAASARVSKGAVYYHFADKAQLFEAVFRQRQQELLTQVAETAGRHRDPWRQLDAALGAYLEGTVADAAQRALLQQAPAALGADRCREIDEQLGLPVLLAALAGLQQTGELVAPPTEMLARVLFSALCEAAMAAGAAPHPDQAQRDARAALRALTAGLRRPPPESTDAPVVRNIDKGDVDRWLQAYVEAWKTYDRAEIAALFAADVSYRYHPYDVPLEGRDAVVAAWLGDGDPPDASSRDLPGTHDATYRAVAVDGDLAVATGTTSYSPQPGAAAHKTFDNCLLLRFDPDGRCREFTEWYMKRPSPTPGPSS